MRDFRPYLPSGYHYEFDKVCYGLFGLKVRLGVMAQQGAAAEVLLPDFGRGIQPLASGLLFPST
jgi:hypothetical protein